MTPDYLKIIIDSFPENLKSDVTKVFSIIPLESKYKFDLISSDFYNVKVSEEILKVPVRIYFDEPKPQNENQLTEIQKDILNCFFTRHHNGFIREKRLNELSEKPEKWKTPFLVQLLGEYVYELFPIIDKKVNNNTLDFYKEFKNENPKYWQQTESRIASYWNKYYRYKFPKLKDYLGIEIINRIKKTNAQQQL
ncbi:MULTISPECIES: hypothetical protein [Winogradskyella]|uniref:Uncharacterized protein n=1 Tax=Winogradskyella marincola TaxID=3037795 RepID=A0ABT6G443_9FLAO|nr:hypothetical protein [Winogradskyella sp. YYF002]MDG4716745.1 hypothetical protein [Winogradskyella sp. YYF002]